MNFDVVWIRTLQYNLTLKSIFWKIAVMAEEFTPITHSPPDSLLNWLKFQARLITDFQVRTVYKHLLAFLPHAKGRVLDVGCGQSPYRYLFVMNRIDYVGIDIEDANQFGYNRDDIMRFDGLHIPFDDNTFDSLICTEVLEHTPSPDALILEMYRVLKSGGVGFITVPWSARTHYMPYDYYRFTPTKLEQMFQCFDQFEIRVRGNDVNTICAKIIVVYLRQLVMLRNITSPWWLFRLLNFVIGIPLVVICIFIGHIALFLHMGSEFDPLGYSVLIRKK